MLTAEERLRLERESKRKMEAIQANKQDALVLEEYLKNPNRKPEDLKLNEGVLLNMKRENVEIKERLGELEGRSHVERLRTQTKYKVEGKPIHEHLKHVEQLHEKYNMTRQRLEEERYKKTLKEEVPFQPVPKIWEFSHIVSEEFFDSVDDCTIIFNKNGQKIVLKSPIKKRVRNNVGKNIGTTGTKNGYDFRKAWFKFLDDYELDEGKVKMYGVDAIDHPSTVGSFKDKLRKLEELKNLSEKSQSFIKDKEKEKGYVNTENPFKGRRKYTNGNDEAQDPVLDTLSKARQTNFDQERSPERSYKRDHSSRSIKRRKRKNKSKTPKKKKKRKTKKGNKGRSKSPYGRKKSRRRSNDNGGTIRRKTHFKTDMLYKKKKRKDRSKSRSAMTSKKKGNTKGKGSRSKSKNVYSSKPKSKHKKKKKGKVTAMKRRQQEKKRKDSDMYRKSEEQNYSNTPQQQGYPEQKGDYVYQPSMSQNHVRNPNEEFKDKQAVLKDAITNINNMEIEHGQRYATQPNKLPIFSVVSERTVEQSYPNSSRFVMAPNEIVIEDPLHQSTPEMHPPMGNQKPLGYTNHESRISGYHGSNVSTHGMTMNTSVGQHNPRGPLIGGNQSQNFPPHNNMLNYSENPMPNGQNIGQPSSMRAPIQQAPGYSNHVNGIQSHMSEGRSKRGSIKTLDPQKILSEVDPDVLNILDEIIQEAKKTKAERESGRSKTKSESERGVSPQVEITPPQVNDTKKKEEEKAKSDLGDAKEQSGKDENIPKEEGSQKIEKGEEKEESEKPKKDDEKPSEDKKPKDEDANEEGKAEQENSKNEEKAESKNSEKDEKLEVAKEEDQKKEEDKKEEAISAKSKVESKKDKVSVPSKSNKSRRPSVRSSFKGTSENSDNDAKSSISNNPFVKSQKGTSNTLKPKHKSNKRPTSPYRKSPFTSAKNQSEVKTNPRSSPFGARTTKTPKSTKPKPKSPFGGRSPFNRNKDKEDGKEKTKKAGNAKEGKEEKEKPSVSTLAGVWGKRR